MKRLFAALGVLVLVLVAAVYFGGRWAAGKYLARDLKVGAGTMRLVSPQFRWSLDLSADSLLYTGPGLAVAAGRTVVSVELFKSLLRFSPSLSLDVDTLALRLSPTPPPDTVKPRPDSIAFPAVKIPAVVRVRAGRILVSDSVGALARCDGLELGTQGPQGITLSIRDAEVRQLGSLRQTLAASAVWEGREVAVRLAWRRGHDSIALDAKLPKANILRASAALRLRVASSVPYASALKLPPGLPRVEGLAADLRASGGKTLLLAGSLRAQASGFSDSLPLKLGTQQLAARIDFKDSAGSWSLGSKGARGEDVSLQGNLFATGRDSLADPLWLIRHLGATAQGHLRGFAVTAGGKSGKADLELKDLRATGAAIRVDVASGDGTSIQADLRKGKGPKPDWNGTFSARIAPGERWLLAFTDTNVAFRKLQVTGRIEGGELAAVAEAAGLKAYGLMADSLRLDGRYGKAGFVLQPSHLYWRGNDWVLAGSVGLAKPGRPMEIHLGNARFGSLDASMQHADLMEARARDLAVDQLPYKGLDALKANQPRVSADFRWDKRERAGFADVKAEGRFKGEALRIHARADWDKERLILKDTRASLAGNEIGAQAKVRLRGRQFYEVAKAKQEDFESVELSADNFDLAKALKAAMPEPPLKSGTSAGRIAYATGAGFSGVYVLKDIHFSGEEEKFFVKEVVIQGNGETLAVRAVTESGVEPLYRDSVNLAVTGILAKTQTITVTARAGLDIFLDFRGTISEYKALEGRLGLHGNVVLPQASGELRNVKVAASVSLPFKEGLKGLRLQADTLGGEYVVAGLDTQSFSAPVRMQGGKITVPDLSMKARSGAELHGRLEFDPPSKRFSADISGSSLAAQIGAGNKLQLRDLRVQAQGDSTLMTVQVGVGSGSVEYIKAPMRVTADVSRLAVFYRAPMGKPRTESGTGGAQIPLLRVNAVLDSSQLRYRLRSLETLTSIFKKEGNKRRIAVRRAKPIQLQLNLETAGRGNSIETDVIRLSYVGNVSMAGIYPYALMQGRISSSNGSLGLKKQAYAIKQMEVKWLNAPLEEGELSLTAQKTLARTCEPDVKDSCAIRMDLTGQLNDIKFAYDSDCRGGYGTGTADVAALIYSVRRGCYSPGAQSGVAGLSYQEQALGMLEPLASNYLSEAAAKLSGHWIASAQVSGLGAFAQDKKSVSETDTAAAGRDALAVEILSREFWRLRLRARSAYDLQSADGFNPWTYRVGVEWQPPIFRLIEDPKWKERVKNKITVDASVFTDPVHDPTHLDDPLRRRLGLNYNYDWWGYWWKKTVPFGAAKDKAADTAAAKRKQVAGRDSAP